MKASLLLAALQGFAAGAGQVANRVSDMIVEGSGYAPVPSSGRTFRRWPEAGDKLARKAKKGAVGLRHGPSVGITPRTGKAVARELRRWAKHLRIERSEKQNRIEVNSQIRRHRDIMRTSLQQRKRIPFAI